MWYKKLPQNYNFVCMTSFENGMCHYLGSRIYTSNLIFVAAIFLATRASHERSQKTSTEFPACFLPRFLSVAIGGRQWQAEERFRNSYMYSLHPHIHRRFFTRQSTIFERTNGDSRLLFAPGRVRLFTFLSFS